MASSSLEIFAVFLFSKTLKCDVLIPNKIFKFSIAKYRSSKILICREISFMKLFNIWSVLYTVDKAFHHIFHTNETEQVVSLNFLFLSMLQQFDT